MGPELWGPEGWGGPKSRVFSNLPPQFSLFPLLVRNFGRVLRGGVGPAEGEVLGREGPAEGGPDKGGGLGEEVLGRGRRKNKNRKNQTPMDQTKPLVVYRERV